VLEVGDRAAIGRNPYHSRTSPRISAAMGSAWASERGGKYRLSEIGDGPASSLHK
jgi:hypothetical protein